MVCAGGLVEWAGLIQERLYVVAFAKETCPCSDSVATLLSS